MQKILDTTFSSFKTILVVLALSGASFAYGQHTHEETHTEEQHEHSLGEKIEHEEHAEIDHIETAEHEEAFDATEMIMHHISDAHSFHLLGEGHESVSIGLPVILYTDNGLVTFCSSEFHHDTEGKVVVEKNGQRFVNMHEHIYYANETANAHGSFVTHNAEDETLVDNAAPLDFSITKNVVTMLTGVIIILLLFISTARFYKKNGANTAPRGLAGFMEPLILYVRDEIARPNMPASKVDKFLPYLLTVFFFIWVNNLLGLVPIFPGSSNLTGNISVTFTLAAFTLIITNVSANKAYWGHIFNTPGVPWWLKFPVPLMPAVELIGVIAKPFALMVRLFANITAGHIIILSLVSIIFIFKNAAWAGLSVPFGLFMSVLELLVAALQAYVFTMLSALFIGMANEEAHH